MFERCSAKDQKEITETLNIIVPKTLGI